VRIPGDGRNAARGRRAADGLALHAALRRELDAIAGELEIAKLAP
jgi:LDH2 family malate/lactate/ureidoglycolate dehydrogenase